MAGYTACSVTRPGCSWAIAHVVKLNTLIFVIVNQKYGQKRGIQERDSFGKFDHGDGRVQQSAGRG